MELAPAPSPTDILNGDLPEGTKIAIVCGDNPEFLCAIFNAVIAVALSGLTGLKAFLPIFCVALGSKLVDDFPLALEAGSWLDSWGAIVCLGLLLGLELIVDCIPALDEIEDAIMLIVKPIIGIVLAIAPFYGEAGSAQQVLFMVVTAINAGLLSEVVALVKAVETVAVDVASAGMCAPVRSIIEDIITLVLSIAVITFGVAMALFVLCLLLFGIVGWIVCRKYHGKSVWPRCWLCKCCCPRKDADDEVNARNIESGHDSDYDSDEDDSGSVCPWFRRGDNRTEP